MNFVKIKIPINIKFFLKNHLFLSINSHLTIFVLVLIIGIYFVP
jgi:hypothetical protein